MRKQRLYSLYRIVESDGKRHLVRCSPIAQIKKHAVQFFQNILIFGSKFGDRYELRPIKNKDEVIHPLTSEYSRV